MCGRRNRLVELHWLAFSCGTYWNHQWRGLFSCCWLTTSGNVQPWIEVCPESDVLWWCPDCQGRLSQVGWRAHWYWGSRWRQLILLHIGINTSPWSHRGDVILEVAQLMAVPFLPRHFQTSSYRDHQGMASWFKKLKMSSGRKCFYLRITVTISWSL